MKLTPIITALILLICATVASAEPVNGSYYQATVFDNATGASATARYSAVIRASAGTKKTVTFYGYSGAGAKLSGGAMSGTAALQCGPTNTGPFAPARDINGAVISGTANTTWDLDTTCRFFRGVWTRTGSKANKLESYILYHD